MPRFEREQSEYMEKLVFLNRVSKTVKGGRVAKFSALMVVGDGKGKVGYGLGKASEVPEAIRKGLEAAKKNMITVTLEGTTIPHETIGEFGAGRGLVAAVAFDFLVQRGSRHQRVAGHVVDDLGIDVLLTAEYVQAGSFGGAGDLGTDSLMTL